MRRLMILPVAALALALLGPVQADDKDPTLDDELRLKNAFQKTDGASLVSFLQSRARGEATHEKLTALIADLKVAKDSRRSDAQVDLARDLQRKAQFRIDFVEAENSMGFHADQEALRVLGLSLDAARRGQLALRPAR